MIYINLKDPIKANSFALSGLAKKICEENESDTGDLIVEEMLSGDRDNVIRVFKKYFSDVVKLT